MLALFCLNFLISYLQLYKIGYYNIEKYERDVLYDLNSKYNIEDIINWFLSKENMTPKNFKNYYIMRMQGI